MAILDAVPDKTIGTNLYGSALHGRGVLTFPFERGVDAAQIVRPGPVLRNASPPPPIYREKIPGPTAEGELQDVGPQVFDVIFTMEITLPPGIWAMTFVAGYGVIFVYNVNGPGQTTGISPNGMQYNDLMNAGPTGFTWTVGLKAIAESGLGIVAGSGYNTATHEPIRTNTIRIPLQP